MSTAKQSLSGIEDLLFAVKDYVPTGLVELKDTPIGYLGHSGDYMIVNDDENGIHFTGIEKIATDLTNHGFGNNEESSNFTGLQDTPNAYSEGDYLRSTSNGLEYITASGLVQDIGDEIVNNIVTGDSLGFTGLNDTPDSYVGQSGQYAIVNNEETTIHFTGIEKIASDLTDYGFDGGGGSTNFTGLQDTPSDYNSGHYLRSTDDGIEYAEPSELGQDILTNTTGLASGYLRIDDDGTGIVTVDRETFKDEIDLQVDFTGLQDTPSDYSEGDYLRSTSNGLGYVTASGLAQDIGDEIVNNIVTGDLLGFTGLNDTPTGYETGKFVRVNSFGDTIEYSDISFLNDIIDAPESQLVSGFLQLDKDGKLVWSPATTDGDVSYTITGATHFTGLLDTPTGYEHSQYLRVHPSDKKLEYISVTGLAEDIGDQIVNNIVTQGSLGFTGLNDTPDSYVGQSGQYAIVNNEETTIHFTGIEKIASDLTNYGFGNNEEPSNFTGLQDTPNAYSEGDYLRSTSNGLEYITASGLVQDIGDEIVNNIVTGDSLGFTGLNDTPDSYVGQGGQYAIVNNEETTIHFTGIEKIANDLTDWGFNGSLDVPKYTILPSAIDNNNKIVASGCDLYYSCNGSWKKINAEDIPPPESAPGCVSNLEEHNQYQEYKEEFLAKNSPKSFDQMLNSNNDISDSINNVCLFSNNDLSTVIIDETNYKWGIFNGTQTINITATPGVVSDREIQFSHWAGEGAAFGNISSSQTTLLLDKDLSVTGYFSEILESTCDDTALHIQSDTTDANTTFTDLSKNAHAITTVGNTQHSTADAYLGTTSMTFDGAGDYLQVGETSTFKFLHDASTDYTIEGWFYLDSSISNSNNTNRIMGHIINDSSDVGIDLFVREDTPGLISYYIYRGQLLTLHRGVSTQAGTFVKDQWNHVAVVYTINNQPKIYLNGQDTQALPDQSYTAGSATTSNNTNQLTIGAVSPGGELGERDWWPGIMQDIRITKKAIYNDNFTPPTSLLSNPCVTCLDVALHIQSNTSDGSTIFDDISDNDHTITTHGDVQHSATDAYLGSTSMSFDGSGDVLKSTNINLSDISTSDFTCEFWFNTPVLRNFNNTPGSQSPRLITDGQNLASRGIGVKLHDDKLLIDLSQSSSGGQTSGHHWELKDFSVTINTWYHVALVRSDDKLYVYVNGIKHNLNGKNNVSSQVDLEYLDCGKLFISDYLCIGGITESIGTYQGLMQDIRITKKAIYNGNFTPPTALLIDLCSVDPVELTCEDIALHTQSNTSDSDSVFVDLSDNNHTITPVGDAQHSITNAYLGSTSMSFDGAGDYLEIGSTNTFKFLHDGSTDYIVECWLRVADLSNNAPNPSRIISTARTTSDIGIDFFVNRNGTLGCWVVGGSGAYKTISLESSSALQSNTWYHIVLQNTVTQDLEIFIDGIKQTAQSATINPQHISVSDSTSMLLVGELVGFGRPLNGQLQDLRIAKKAVYTSNFNPPNSLLDNLC